MELPVRTPIKTTMEIYFLSRSKVIVMITGPGIVTGSLFRKFYLANVRCVFLCYYWFHHTLKATVRIYYVSYHTQSTLSLLSLFVCFCALFVLPPFHFISSFLPYTLPQLTYPHFPRTVTSYLNFVVPFWQHLNFSLLFTVYLHYSILWEM